jgi:hypothetical protein
MLSADLSKVDKDMIERLVTNAVPESTMLEYKEQLVVSNDAQKKEFLADVSSFANASGGDLIFGISEARDADGKPTNVPSAAVGLAGVGEPDKVRLESMIMDGIAPRMSVRMKLVPGFANGPVLVVRIARGWAGPHMVTFQNVSRFYSRSSAGKFQLDIHQLRASFAQAEALPERLRSLRIDRVGRIMAGDAPGNIGEEQTVILHLVPYGAFDPSFGVDVRAAYKDGRLKPMGATSWSHRYNLDGPVATVRGSGDYTQMFRNGVLEAVCTLGVGSAFLASGVEQYVLEELPRLRDLVHALGSPPPLALMLTIINVRACKLNLPPRFAAFPGTEYVADRNELLLPMVVLETDTQDLYRSLQAPFDAMWQAFGFDESPRYRDQV